MKKLRMDFEYNLKSVKDKIEDRYKDTLTYTEKLVNDKTETLLKTHDKLAQSIEEAKSLQQENYGKLFHLQAELKEQLTKTNVTMNTQFTYQKKLLFIAFLINVVLLVGLIILTINTKNVI